MKKSLLLFMLLALMLGVTACGKKDAGDSKNDTQTLDEKIDEVEEAENQTEATETNENSPHTIQYEDKYRITMTIPEGMYDYLPELEDSVSYNGAIIASFKKLEDEQRIKDYLAFHLESSQDLLDGVQEEEIGGYKCYYAMYEFKEESKRSEDEITYFLDCNIPLNDEVMMWISGNLSDYDFNKILHIQDEDNANYVAAFKQILEKIIDGMGPLDEM